MTNEAPITTLGLALIVAFTTAVSTAIPLWFSSRRKTKDHDEAVRDRKEDWARQDAVAQQVREAKETLAENKKETNEKLDGIKEQATEIHELVNSKMTEAMLGQLDEAVRGLVSLKEIVSLRKENGQEPSSDTLGAIKATEKRIEEFQARVNDRKNQQATIDAKKK